MGEFVLGISAYYHDSAAALLNKGEIVAAASEERFTRIKYDAGFPRNAVKYVLEEAGLKLEDLIAVSFYEKPFLKFERLLETYHGFAPKGLKSYLSAMPLWIKEKLFMKKMLKDELLRLDMGQPGKLLFPQHHLSHAASAFYPSPFDEAAILTIDGVGEWATTTIGLGKNNEIMVLQELEFPHSLGLLYSAFTYYCGFRVNSGEYKLMGLAPYGNSDSAQCKKFKKLILDEIVDLREDGSFLLNMAYFNFATGLTMCVEDKWEHLFEIGKREPESTLSQPYMELARAIQDITEEIVLRLAATAKKQTCSDHLVMAGGVALNCVANGKLLRTRMFKDIWIQPASGDAGGALGAAYAAWHIWHGKNREVNSGLDSMKGAYLGPSFSETDVKRLALKYDATYDYYQDFDGLCKKTAKLLAQGNVVGWFQRRMEFGPRALGNRSILADPRDSNMQKRLNLKIKFREGFRPFAPTVLEEEIYEYFDLDRPSPYMLLVAPVQEKRRSALPENYHDLPMYERLYYQRSDIPAVTHVDYSARIQSVNRFTNERYWKLIKAFKELTRYGVVVNTSFNVRGEPIVCTPDDAYKCFMRTEMDWLVIENFLFDMKKQPPWTESASRKERYRLD